MWAFPVITVIGFFTLIGVTAVGRLAMRLDYWMTDQKVRYIARIVTVHAGVGLVASIGTVGYMVAPRYTTLAFSMAWLIAFVGVFIVVQQIDFGHVASQPITGWIRQFTHHFSTVHTALVLGATITIPFALGLMFESEALLGGWMLSGAVLGYSTKTAEVSHKPADQGQESPDAMNVVICMVDSLRRDRMSLYGYNRETTPFLDRTRDNAYMFKNCIAPGTRSGHSIPSLLTGTYASEHGYGRNLNKLRLLSDEFREQGYTTMCISGNPHVTNSKFGDRFDWFVRLRRGKDYLFAVQRLVNKGLAKLGLRHVPSHYFFVDIEFIHELATAFITEAAEGDCPFFCYLSYMDIHDPYVREFTHIKAFAESHGGTVERGRWIRKRDGLPETWYNEVIKNWGYDETVQYTDRNLATLFDFLEDKNLRNETVVVVTSDHGDMLGERGYWGHMDIPFNPLIEVPLLIYPASSGGDNSDVISNKSCETVSQIVSGTDIPSLVCDAAGIDPSNAMREQWAHNLTLSECILAGDAENYCLVDNNSTDISTKGYEHPITSAGDQQDSPPETTVRQQRLLVGPDWKLYQVNNELRFYRYDDAYFDNPVPDKEVPERVRKAMHASISDLNVFLAEISDETEDKPYDDVTCESVRQQLKDLGYL